MANAEHDPIIEMRQGAVAVVDALGFKEARKLHPLDDLVNALRDVQTSAASQAGMNSLFGGAPTTIAAFSDSVILATYTQMGDDPRRRRAVSLSDSVYNLASCAASMMVKAASARASLAYRGCVAAGAIHAVGSIFVGEAIDEAAELSALANAAVTWLAPSARAAVSSDQVQSRIAYVEWELHLKERGPLFVMAINPFLHEAIDRITDDLDAARLDAIEAALLSPLIKSSRLDVVQKHQNTAAFLKLAKAHTVEAFPQMQEDYYDSQGEMYAEYEAERGRND